MTRIRAEANNEHAQFNLGGLFEQGRGVAKDEAAAAAWYRKAAVQGHASAQHNLGLMLGQGRGVANDEAGAMAWIRKAAGQGQPKAIAFLDASDARA